MPSSRSAAYPDARRLAPPRKVRESTPNNERCAIADPTQDDTLAFARAVGLGLSDRPRWLPSRYLYDAEGSALFEEITQLPEYYPTRTEAGILAAAASAIRAITGPVTLIELGSGSSTKTSHLLEAYGAGGDPVHYVPVDVSDTILQAAYVALQQRHPGVQVTPVQGTYADAFPLFEAHSPSMALFLGSTLGNFNQTEAAWFWEKVSRHLRPGDYFLLGVDLVKDPAILEAAYNDADGVTARFTRNLFARMNRELGSALDLASITHVARYNAPWQRIETHARFETAQDVHLAPLERRHRVEAGAEVMIEISRKFEIAQIEALLHYYGFHLAQAFTDPRGWCAVLLLRRAPARG